MLRCYRQRTPSLCRGLRRRVTVIVAAPTIANTFQLGLVFVNHVLTVPQQQYIPIRMYVQYTACTHNGLNPELLMPPPPPPRPTLCSLGTDDGEGASEIIQMGGH